MKKGALASILFLMLLVLIIAPTIRAVEFSLSKTNYQPQETLQLEFNGNFLDNVRLENINLYKQGIPRPIPIVSDLTKQGEDYYFYALLPNQDGNFSIRIEGLSYTELGETKAESIIKNFTINRTNEAALKIDPGFIVTSTDFSIKLTSLFGNLDSITVELEATKEIKNVSLIEGAEKKLDFSVLNKEGKTNLKIVLSKKSSGGFFSKKVITTGYDIPVFLISKPVIPDPVHPVNNETLEFSPSQIKGALIAGTNFLSKVILENTGNETIKNIELSSDLSSVKIQPSTVDSLAPNQNITLNISIVIDKKAKGNVSGDVTASFGSQTRTIPVFFEITKKLEEVNTSGTSVSKLSCSDEPGTVCDYANGETCDGKTTDSIEGQCCLGKCKAPPNSNTNWIIGVLIILVLGGVLGYFYLQAKNKQKIKSTEEILAEKSKKFGDRMKGTEISGGLGNI